MMETIVVKPTMHIEDVLYPKYKAYDILDEKVKHSTMTQYMASEVNIDKIYNNAEVEYKHILEPIFCFMKANNIAILESHWTHHACISFDKEHKHAVVLFGSQYLKELTTPEFIAVLSHELGHFLDFKFYDKNPHDFEIIELEMVAWKLAEDFLEALGYSNWIEFNAIKKFGLTSYAGSEYEYNVKMQDFHSIVNSHICD